MAMGALAMLVVRTPIEEAKLVERFGTAGVARGPDLTAMGSHDALRSYRDAGALTVF